MDFQENKSNRLNSQDGELKDSLHLMKSKLINSQL